MGSDDTVYKGFTHYAFDNTYWRTYNNLVSVDSSLEYDFSVWIKSPQKCRLYIELRDQDGNHAIDQGAINNSDPNGLQTGRAQLISGIEAPNTWTFYKTTLKFHPKVRSVYIGGIYGSHSSGPQGTTFIGADMALRVSQVPQSEIDRRQDETFILHENQLKWLNWTKPIVQYTFPTTDGYAKNLTTGLVDIESNSVSGNGLRVIIRPAWKGTYSVEYKTTDGEKDTVFGTVFGSAIKVNEYTKAATKVVYNVVLSIYPDYKTDPREWVFRCANGSIMYSKNTFVLTNTTTKGFALNCDSKATQDVISVSGVKYKTGSLIPANTFLNGVDTTRSGIVVFTEIQPRLYPTVGAPLSGLEKFEGGIERIPQSEWTTVLSWHAPEWNSGVSVKATILYRTNWNWWNAIAIGVNYETRVVVGGSVAKSHSISSFGAGRDALYVNEQFTTTLKRGDYVQLQVRCNAGIPAEREVFYSGLAIGWGDVEL